MDSPEHIQRSYYARTAHAYEDHHLAEAGSHEAGLAIVSALMDSMGCASVLDVGAGTGRSLQYLRERHPGLRTLGVEPSDDLLQIAKGKGLDVIRASGAALPFPDDSFDVVIETGVLHHVKDPHQVVREMTRVAKKAVFISDSNRFGQGSSAGKLAKLLLSMTGLWRAADWLRTRGRGYHVSEGDGLFYSYSVFDTLPDLSPWARQVFTVPLAPLDGAAPHRWAGPLLSAGEVLVCALRSPISPQKQRQ